MSDTFAGTLIDTGPLVASILTDEPNYAATRKLFTVVSLPLVTTSACMAESFHFLGKSGGRASQINLWDLVVTKTLQIANLDDAGTERARRFMMQYAYCDYADATLLAVAEARGFQRILSFDSHFFAYRLTDGSALEVLPGQNR